MMLFHFFQSVHELVVMVPDVSAWGDTIQHSMHVSPADWSFFAQQFETDVFADFRNFFNNFIESGQVWALIVGLVLGYLLRGLTSYG